MIDLTGLVGDWNMKIIKDKEEIERIVEYNKGIKIKDFFALNTPWAKDETGKRDEINLALFVEFIDKKTKEESKGFWLVSESEINYLLDCFIAISQHNREKDSKGIRFKKELFDKLKMKKGIKTLKNFEMLK